jgi:hypothetical protein
MKQALHDTVLAIATDVRYWAEGRSTNDDLNGWCAIASAELFRQLQKEEIPAEIHYSLCRLDGESCHVYLLVDDHVVDVTATQFKQLRDKPVVIMHSREAEAYDFYNADEVFYSVEDLRAYQRKHRWPAEQIAYGK